MLKLSKSVEYSLLALLYISEQNNNSLLSSKLISEKLDIPYELLSKLLQKMVKKEIIKSEQGKYGGYRLLIPLKKLTISDIITAIDENIQIADCTFPEATKKNCNKIDSCKIKTPFNIIQNKIIGIFESVTLEQLSK